MKSLKLLIGVSVFSLFALQVFADVNPSDKNRTKPKTTRSAGCDPATTSADLELNNVRARIHTGGDMWWDLQGKPKYEVPKGSGRSALFAGSIWVGGKDANGQLKLAAQRFRQVGIDFWPGPLIISGSEIATVTSDICHEYDKFFHITREQVDEFRAYMACQNDPNCNTAEEFAGYAIPDIILNWPAHGPAGGYDYHLAPFWDVNGDDVYNPYDGDFPYYEYPDEYITTDKDCLRPRDQKPRLFGDETFWWVYNDKGNIHTETGGEAIGMEFRAQAFAFATNNELNDMTFYNYNIINRSTYTLFKTYFGVWTDADLGGPKDDYTGCDVIRGLGYVYNGDEDDENHQASLGYGKQPPAIGIDFFEGPYQDPDGLDNPTSFDTINGVKVLNCNKGDILNGNINGLNFQDSVIDNERWGMRRFIYFNNDNTVKGDPKIAIEYYNYMTGFWRDNQPLIYGGDGYPVTGNETKTNFMFPGDTDPCGWGQGGIPQDPWSEETEGTAPEDRRFIQSAGPFTLTPGAVNDITLGAVYARAVSGTPFASVEAVRKADDKAQILFENCFRVLNGPDAPDLEIIEMDKKLIFHILNESNSNNYLETYREKDPSIICFDEIDPCDQYYKFQGYQVFQLKSSDVSITDRYNNDLVREIFQCDIKDDVTQLVNYTFSDLLGANVPVEEVNGSNTGVTHSFVIEDDFFAQGDKRLVNHRKYYYTAIAYGYNETMPYNQQIEETFNGQKKPYLAGRKNIKKYEAIPHINKPENEGTIIQGEYGFGPKITQVEGWGNGNNVIDLTQETIDEIMSGSPWKAQAPVYKNGAGPVKIKVIDPLNIKDASYTLRMKNATASLNACGLIAPGAEWELTNSAGEVVESLYPIDFVANEQLLPEYGLSIEFPQVEFAAYENKNNQNNGFLEASMEFKDDTKPWLSFIPDADGPNPLNWIRTGTYKDGTLENPNPNYNDYLKHDPNQVYEKILGGTWAPYLLVSDFKYGPGFKIKEMQENLKTFSPLSSVDIVITPDKSKWSRSVVLEMCENEWTVNDKGHEVQVTPLVNHLSENNALRFNLRKHPSVDKEGNIIPGDTTHGLGWFPGYAIDVKTGERLNIAFGEDSWLIGANGRDLIWNPTGQMQTTFGDPVFGGKHYIYVFGHSDYSALLETSTGYDGCANVYQLLLQYEATSNVDFKKRALRDIMWTAMPIANPNFDFLSTEVKIRLRVSTPYFQSRGDFVVDNPVNDNYPLYKFSTHDIKTLTHDNETAESALDLIRVVPNPYYGHSYYEHAQLENYVRITNLPQKCTIRIYNVSGRLIREFNKDNADSYIDWDLKNGYNINIASGAYVVHIQAPGIGEKVVKWFGVMRPVDLQNF